MKALTLHQPWASLVALGVKTVETRGWATSYRGPLAIHAGTHRPLRMNLPPLWSVGKTRDEQREANRQTWHVVDTITDPAHKRPHRTDIRDRVPRRATTPTLFYPSAGPHGRPWDQHAGTSATEQGTAVLLPLGAVVATATLVDVVPTSDLPVKAGTGWDYLPEGRYSVSPDQLPLGDFRPGRYAWLLDHVVATAPLPARGHQGLWQWWPPCCLCGPGCQGLDGTPPCNPRCAWCIHGCATPDDCCLEPTTPEVHGSKVAP